MEQNKKLETIILDWIHRERKVYYEKAVQTQSELDWHKYFIYDDLVGELFNCQFEALSDEGKERVARMFDESLGGS